MPCYTAWNEGIPQGTPEHHQAEKKVRAWLRSIKHIIDYYYRAYDYPMPNIPDGTKVDLYRQPKSQREQRIREAICHHVQCDGMNVSMLYDASSLLDQRNKEERAYLAVLLPCATLLAPGPDEFKMAYQGTDR